jgi:hypothetical protein
MLPAAGRQPSVNVTHRTDFPNGMPIVAHMPRTVPPDGLACGTAQRTVS